MRQARDRQRESLSLSDSNPGNSVANIFRHRSSSRRGYELPSLLNDNKVFLIDDTDKAELFSAFLAKRLSNTAILEADHITTTKANARHANINYRRRLTTLTPSRPQRVHGVSGHSGHQMDLWTNYSIRTAPTVASASASISPPTSSTDVDRFPQPPLSSSSSSSSPSYSSFFSSTSSSSAGAPTSDVVAFDTLINITHNPDTPTNTNTTTTVYTSDADLVSTCPHCDRTFTSHIGMVGHLRIHCIETGEPVPGAPTYTRRIRLHCTHYIRTFIHRMGPLGHMRDHEKLQYTTARCTTSLHPPSSASRRTSTSPIANTQLPPPTQWNRIFVKSPVGHLKLKSVDARQR
ncbi:hypothetical protein SprV_0200762100 [Sparganum proliferum]